MKDYSPTKSYDFNPIAWGNLTETQKRVAKAAAFLVGPGVIERPTLEAQASESETIKDIVDNKDRLMTSLQYTNLLNTLVEKGYLVKISQGGSPVVFDTRPEEGQVVRSSPFGDVDKFQELIKVVLDREGVEFSELESIEYGDVNATLKAVNESVEGKVLAIAGTPSRYGLPASTGRMIINNSIEDVDTPYFTVSLFNQYSTIDHSTSGFEMEATIESISEGMVNIVITDANGYLDEAYFEIREREPEVEINDAFDVVFISNEEVYILLDEMRSEEVKAEVRDILARFEQQLISADEGEG